MLKYFIFTNVTEIFITNLYISFYISIFLTSNLIILLLWYFLIPGLYKFENIKILKYLFLFFILSYFIINIILLKIIPNIWYFFLSINFSNNYLFNIYFEPKINTYFNFYFLSFIYFFFIFCYFFIFYLLLLNNIIKLNLIITLRKFFYLKFILISSIISTPDIFNQFFIFINLILFFEIYIFIFFILNRYFFNKS